MKVSLVGAGPGDPGLLTLKGQELIAAADVIVYDALANSSLLDFAKKEAELIYVGKIADNHALPQDEINALLVSKATENGGKNVVRLKGGDPYIFGRGGEEAEYLVGHNIPYEEVPGISSAIAAPAYAGIPLTHRGYTASLTILTGHEKPEREKSAHNWQALAQSGSTLVFVMGMKNLPFITGQLMQGGLSADTPVALIYRGTTPMQRVLVATLDKISAEAEKAGFANPTVIVIGKVVELQAKLDWFSQKPLLGRRLIVTRAREQASDLAAGLSMLGAEVFQCPSIQISPLPGYDEADCAIGRLSRYKWLIFTSVNGVAFFWERLKHNNLDSRALSSCKIAAIGSATASALAARGITADLVPSSYVAEELARAIVAADGESLADSHILLPRAAKARMVLPDTLAAAGAIVDVVPVYEAIPGSGCDGEVLELLENGQIDCIAFGSSSTVTNFLNFVPVQWLKQVALAAIGPITAKTLHEYGLEPRIQPSVYTIPALIEAIKEYFVKQGKQ